MFRDKSRDFGNVKLTAEQASGIKDAFDSGVAMCFAFDEGCGAAPKLAVASKILENHPDAFLAKCDVFYDGTDPLVWKDMVLVIKKKTDNESFNKMVDEIIVPSGAISQAIFIAKSNENGVKKAVKREFANAKLAVVKMANLLVDETHLLLTIRTSANNIK